MSRKVIVGVLSTTFVLTALGTAPGSAADAVQQQRPGPAGPAAAEDSEVLSSGGIDAEAMRTRILREGAGEVVPARAPLVLRGQDDVAAGDADAASTAGSAAVAIPPRRLRGGNVRVDGTLTTAPLRARKVAPSREDDGSIPAARDLGSGSRAVVTTGRIGDGPHGSAGDGTGDYDFYRIRARAGDMLSLDLDPRGDFGSVANILVYDATGELLAGAGVGPTGDVYLGHPVERTGAIYVALGVQRPSDPFESGSGAGIPLEGRYRLEVAVRSRPMNDVDVYAVRARRGEVLGATVAGAARRLVLLDPRGRPMQTAAADTGALYPRTSPLPRGGNATVNQIVQRSGRYLLAVEDGRGRYSLTVGTHRAPTSADARRQTILLDFDGTRFDNRIFGASVVDPGVRTVSATRDLLPRWGLPRSAAGAVIRATTQRVRAVLRDDIPGSRVRVVTTRTHPRLWGRPGVTRLIVGGTADEAGLGDVFGLAESVDPGNFDREETAIVMPGPMSGNEPLSLNQYLNEDSDRVGAVGQALGNVAAHEAGHLLGNFHTDDYDDNDNVMNTGYLLHFFARGADGVAGTADDDRLAMRASLFDQLQGSSGIQDTRKRTRAALR